MVYSNDFNVLLALSNGKLSTQEIYHNILANRVTEKLKVVLESLREAVTLSPGDILGNELLWRNWWCHVTTVTRNPTFEYLIGDHIIGKSIETEKINLLHWCYLTHPSKDITYSKVWKNSKWWIEIECISLFDSIFWLEFNEGTVHNCYCIEMNRTFQLELLIWS